MRRSRLQFKYALRQGTCMVNEVVIRVDKYAKSLLHKDMLSFWKHIRDSNNARVPLTATMTSENGIAEMWQDHYKSLLNSVKTVSHQQFVTNKLSSIRISRFCFPFLTLT